MKIKHLLGSLSLVFCLSSASNVHAASPLDNFNERVVTAEESAETINKASKALDEIIKMPEGLPLALLQKAEGIVIIPDMVTVAAGISSSIGRGIALIRKDNEWSNPNFVSLTKAGFGVQVGAQSTDIVLLFKSRDGLEKMVTGEFELNANAGIAAGPIGRAAEVATDISFESMIYSYSRSKGLFAGVSLGGSALEIDEAANTGLYGKKVEANDVFSGTVKIDSESIAKLREVLKTNVEPKKEDETKKEGETK
jgi:lipid-binding SYLF domain-containing protein